VSKSLFNNRKTKQLKKKGTDMEKEKEIKKLKENIFSRINSPKGDPVSINKNNLELIVNLIHSGELSDLKSSGYSNNNIPKKYRLMIDGTGRGIL
jgi:hypothetical protein